MEFLFRQRYAADCKNIAQISMTITNVAKPKKRPARKQPKSEPIDVSAEATVESSNPGLNEAAGAMTPIEPVIARPLLFKISLVAFVGWLVYLAYIAYVVLR